VLDLGAAPGSWALYAAERVGPKGRVVAVDLQEIRQAFPPNVVVVRGDAFALGARAAAVTTSASVEQAGQSHSVDSGSAAPLGNVVDAHAPYDVVLSDMAPNTSGSKISDQARSYDLFMTALSVALAVGKAGSRFVGKIFMSDDFPKAKSAVASRYRDVRVIRPEGTRSNSSEVFVVGLGKTS